MTKTLKIIFSFILIVVIASAQTEEKAQDDAKNKEIAEQKDTTQNKILAPKPLSRNGMVKLPLFPATNQ